MVENLFTYRAKHKCRQIIFLTVNLSLGAPVHNLSLTPYLSTKSILVHTVCIVLRKYMLIILDQENISILILSKWHLKLKIRR